MSSIHFSWDESRNRSNQRKHGVSFETAVRVFSDPLHMLIQDRLEDGEERWLILGQIGSTNVVIVAHTYSSEKSAHEFKEEVRIISARLATRKERRAYEEH